MPTIWERNYFLIAIFAIFLQLFLFCLFVIWIITVELKRELTNVDKAKVIIERLKKSKGMLYIHTEASITSSWALTNYRKASLFEYLL